jgi:hypothetical protein
MAAHLAKEISMTGKRVKRSDADVYFKLEIGDKLIRDTSDGFPFVFESVGILKEIKYDAIGNMTVVPIEKREEK